MITAKYKDKDVKIITNSSEYVIIEMDGNEIVLDIDNSELLIEKIHPCKGCGYECYNWQIGDCRDDDNRSMVQFNS